MTLSTHAAKKMAEAKQRRECFSVDYVKDAIESAENPVRRAHLFAKYGRISDDARAYAAAYFNERGGIIGTVKGIRNGVVTLT